MGALSEAAPELDCTTLESSVTWGRFSLVMSIMVYFQVNLQAPLLGRELPGTTGEQLRACIPATSA